MGLSIPLLLLLTITSSPLQSSSQSLLQILPTTNSIQKDDNGDLFCDSWRLSAETGNVGPWEAIPSRCVSFVASYMNGEHYVSDSDVVAAEALDFAATVPVSGDGRDTWVFDVDETLLSNLPYYKQHGYGSGVFNNSSFDEWVDLAKAPVLPASLKLYEQLQGLGFRIVLLTGRSEDRRAATERNLRYAGYRNWERFILRGPSDPGRTAVAYKSSRRAELAAWGYRIHGSSGDQWSDLVGSPMAARSFKLPNPIFFRCKLIFKWELEDWIVNNWYNTF